MGKTYHFCRECQTVHRMDATCLEGAEERRRSKKRDWSDTRAPPIRTDDNNPLKGYGAMLGKSTKTRADVRAREAEGIVFTNERDRDVMERGAPQKEIPGRLEREFARSRSLGSITTG